MASEPSVLSGVTPVTRGDEREAWRPPPARTVVHAERIDDARVTRSGACMVGGGRTASPKVVAGDECQEPLAGALGAEPVAI